MHLHWTTSRGPSSCEICILNNNKQTQKKNNFLCLHFSLNREHFQLTLGITSTESVLEPVTHRHGLLLFTVQQQSEPVRPDSALHLTHPADLYSVFLKCVKGDDPHISC
ncbi:hypothetical protein FQA47_007917 [Oryzias melastigma]|uniref:Uncharacterized protein n=1 Tax=Oryzias melastigma TaxID=30732 RepID=A0A834C2L2_ORYME|nr:hypothetical protein FQA47_007917 [Oryzias melastigma]